MKPSPWTPGEVTLEWGDSCRAADRDFSVYHGTLGDFGSHVPAACTTDGANSLVLTPLSGDLYYLVVPTNGYREGSYGSDADGVERSARRRGLPAAGDRDLPLDAPHAGERR